MPLEVIDPEIHERSSHGNRAREGRESAVLACPTLGAGVLQLKAVDLLGALKHIIPMFFAFVLCA
jgi:hypothetical protein